MKEPVNEKNKVMDRLNPCQYPKTRKVGLIKTFSYRDL
jgi:hypothetical protein